MLTTCALQVQLLLTTFESINSTANMENTFETILKQISEIQEHMQRNEADNNSQINHLLTINANQKYETVLALLELEKKNVLKMTGSYSKQKI